MSKDKLLTVREVAQILKCSEKEVIDLAEEGKIPAYKIGGQYLRFQRQQIEEFKQKQPIVLSSLKQESLWDKLIDFFYFNDFYIVSALIIILLFFIIIRSNA
ncbi:MAG: helix-turn-helix domain-containing protein [Candidatus Omnitrophica bacterium]|nr:helix-turn-helix domain-containing protein [Candidatus Omnitrophota bacterium]